MAPQSMLIGDIGSTWVRLNLSSWLDGGCPIAHYNIEYKVWGQHTWTEEISHISGLQVSNVHI